MAHPKHKVSSTRRDKRRTHYKAVVPTVVTCSNCGAAVLYHRVCPECGFYRGKLAIEKKAAEECIPRECLFFTFYGRFRRRGTGWSHPFRNPVVRNRD